MYNVTKYIVTAISCHNLHL